MNDPVRMIPIDRIRILNPRHRDKMKFQPIVESIKNLGQKKPIQVRPRPAREGDELTYDLVCGQGRIEACRASGFTEIAAMIVDIPKEECLLRSLIENMARRSPDTRDLIVEIERLKVVGYSNTEIGKKLDLHHTTIGALLHLKTEGEKGLLDAALRGKIPVSAALEISKAKNVEAQRELLKAYESKQLPYTALRTVRRLIEQRRFIGKEVRGERNSARVRTSAESLVNAYRRESQRQKVIIKKARICDEKLRLLVQAFSQLMTNENFVNLLRAEGLANMPQFLSEKINGAVKEAA
jgi:ParB family chromosome partitioning protein